MLGSVSLGRARSLVSGFAGFLGAGLALACARQERQTAAYDFSLVLSRFTSVNASSHKLARVQRALQRASKKRPTTTGLYLKLALNSAQLSFYDGRGEADGPRKIMRKTLLALALACHGAAAWTASDDTIHDAVRLCRSRLRSPRTRALPPRRRHRPRRRRP